MYYITVIKKIFKKEKKAILECIQDPNKQTPCHLTHLKKYTVEELQTNLPTKNEAERILRGNREERVEFLNSNLQNHNCKAEKLDRIRHKMKLRNRSHNTESTD